MLFLALFLAIIGTVVATREKPSPETICQDPALCLKINALYIVQPTKPTKKEDNISLDFKIYDPNSSSENPAEDTCDVDWKYGTDSYPQTATPCYTGDFTYYLEEFVAIDKSFYIEATYSVTVGTDITTSYARGKVSLEHIECHTAQSSFKSCELKEGAEIYLVKYTPPNKPDL